MRDDERYIIDGLDLRVELDRLLALPVFHGSVHDIERPTLKVRRSTRQPRRLGFARGGHTLSVSFAWTTNHDRFDAQEVLIHELTHIWFQQLDIDERVAHSSKFWNMHDLVFEQATGIDPRSLPPRTNIYHGRYASAMRRAALVTHGEELVEAALRGNVQTFLDRYQLRGVEFIDPDADQVSLEDVAPLELRGSSWDEVSHALRIGRAVQLPNGDVRHTLRFDEFTGIVERDDDGRWMEFIDPNAARELTEYERAFLAGELDSQDYVRPAVIDLPEPFKSLPEPERVPGGPAVLSLPEYAPDYPRRPRSVDAPRFDDRYGAPLPVEDRAVTRGWYNVEVRDRNILNALRSQGPMTARELAGYLRITDGQARHATSRLRRQHLIEKPHRGAPWQLVY